MKPDCLTLDAARAKLVEGGWIASCNPEALAPLMALASVRHVGAGQSFNRAGDPEGGIWGLVAGQAAGTSGINSPSAPISLLYMPGEWGGTGPLSGSPRIGDVVARVDCTILAVAYHSAKRLLAEQPRIWEVINRINFEALVKFGTLAVDLQLRDSRTRIAAILLNAAGLRLRGIAPVTIALSQDELGTMANLSRQPAADALRAFAADGLVALRYGRITVLQPSALRAIANRD